MDGETPDSQSPPSTWILVSQYIICYVLWLLICGIGLWLIFLIRTNLVEDVFFMRLDPWQLSAIDRWAIYGFGALWIFSIFLIEGYLRRAVEQGRLFIVAGRILLIQLALVALSFLINSV